MPSKRQRHQWKNARAALLPTFKKTRQESSSLPNLLQLDDDTANTTDTSDTEGESGSWFWHKSANESDSNGLVTTANIH